MENAYIPLGLRKPVDIVINEMQPLNTAISDISEVFYAELPKITTKGDRLKLKMALKSCINRIECYYEQL